MMATAAPESGSSLLPLLESLEDSTAGQPEQTDVYLTIASRLSGEEGRQFLPAVEKHFSRLGKAILTHITGPNPELSQAALQALGFCVYHAHVVSGVSENFASEILSALCSLVVSSTDKNSCTRALWVISKQSFPSEVVAKKVDPLLEMLERVMSRRDIQSLVMEHEALNVVIRLLEQAPVQMGVAAVRWSKLVIPMVVHSASKVRLRAAAAMELGLPLLLERQNEVAAVIEPLMPTILVPELQKLFASKNEVNVLKLWPLFVKLLGKHLHRGGPFINSLLHLEELGFRSSSPNVKKIAFIAWKSLIDNFALNPEILCSAKRMKLLLQPLLSIHVRTEALQLSRLEVWWYLVVRLGPNLGPHFEQVSIPLLQCTIRADSSTSTLQAGTPVRGAGQNSTLGSSTPKTGNPTCFNSPANTPRLNLSLSQQAGQSFPPIQLLGLEMLLHYFLGPEVVPAAARVNLQLTLEPLTHSFLSGGSTFSKHAALLISSVTHGFISVGADAPDPLLVLIWRSLVSLVSSTVDSGSSSKKERQGSEVLTLMLQALQTIAASEALPPSRVLVLLEITVKAIHPRVLGSAAYQVGKMDVLNGTPALFLILLLYNSDKLSTYAEDERFFQCLNTLVGCGLAGPTSSLAFVEAVLGAAARRASFVPSKEHLWRMWSAVVTPLTDAITQSNEVNQGDALEHDFSAVHSSLMFPVRHLLLVDPLPQMTQKSLLSTWSKLYRVFARCSALVLTAEENVSCEELCVRMAAFLNVDTLARPATLDAVSGMLQVMVECVDFSPYTPTFQQKTKSPCTPVNWTRKRSQALGNLAAFQALLIQALEAFLVAAGPSDSTGLALASVLSTLFNSLAQATPLRVALGSLAPHLAVLYRRAAATTTTSETPAFSSQLVTKLEKLLVELLGHLQSRSTLDYDDQLLLYLAPLLCVAFPHKNKALRTQATHFWNATFAKASSLAYPEELKPVLSQVKRKTPIILPGFEAVAVSDEHSGPYSSDCSQLDTKLSGVQMPSAGKRDSLLGRAAELKDQSAKSLAKPVSTKLDFGSPKPPPRGVLEEEASIDFVFIPPENKERVLTEHQKEVKRTKRGDLPAMYNNLDASLDTTAFTQYTQSQEDSTEKLIAEQPKSAESPVKVDEMEVEGESDLLYKDTEDYTSPGAAKNKDPAVVEQEGGVIPDSADVSMQDAQENPEPNEGASADVSGGSDLVSGTPPKPNSRRQSFITLEKYVEGQAASPIQVTKFTGRLTRPAKDKASPAQADISSPSRDEPMASEISSPSRDEPKLSEIYSPSRDDPTLSETSSPSGVEPLVSETSAPSGVEPMVSETSSPSGDEPKLSETLRPTESSSPPDSTDSDQTSSELEENPAKRHSSGGTEDEDDVIPDTQATSWDESATGRTKEESDGGAAPEEQESNGTNQETVESDGSQEDANNSQSISADASRRSGRIRVRPRLPGQCSEDEEEEEKQKKKKKKKDKNSLDYKGRTGSVTANKADDLSPQSRSGRRGRLATSEVNQSEESLRKSPRIDKKKFSQSDLPARGSRKTALYSQSSYLLGSEEEKPRRRSARGGEHSQTDSQPETNTDSDSQSQARRSLRKKAAATETEKPATAKQQAKGSAAEKPPVHPRLSAPKKHEPPPPTGSPAPPHSQNESQSQKMPDAKTTVISNSEEFEPERHAGKVEAMASLSAPVTPSPVKPAPQAPAPENPASQVPASQVPASQVPASQVPASQVPASEAAAPDEAASEAAAPDEAAPDEAAPEAAAPDEAAPEAAAPDEAAPEAAAPDEAAPEAAAPDEAAPEAAAPDEAAPEAAAPDEAAPDEAAPDEAAPDEAAPDEAAPDEAAPDEASAEAPAAPETSTYKVVTPETIVSEEATPETSAPETSAPETAAPETAAPETAAPETAAPETAAPETAAPETAAPETTAPKDGTPEATSEAPAAPEEATTVAPAASQAPAAPETAALPSQTDRQPKPRRSELSLLIEGLSGSSTDEDKRRAGAANSISQEDSQALTLSSSGSQLQNRLRRRGKASAQSLEAAEKSQNLTESELDAEAQASPSAVRTRTRSSFPHGEQVSQTIFSSLDKAALAARKPNSGRGKYPRRRSSQALLANNENSESESSETRESPPSKKKISYHKAPLVPSPLTVQSAAMDDASETSQSDPSQGTPTISPSKTKSLLQSQKEALISLSRVPLVFTELEQQCEVGVIPIVALEQVPEKAGTENTNPIAPNTDLKCKLSLIAPSEEDCEQRLSQAKLDPSDQVPLDCESTDTITERSQEVLLPPVSAAPTSATNASSNEDEDDGDDEVFTDATDLSSAPADHRSTPAASGEATANQSSSASGSSEEKVQHVAQPAQEEVIAEVPQANSSEPSGVPADGKGCEDAASTPAKQDEGAPQKALDILVVEQEVGQISSREDPAGLAEATTSVQDEVRAAQAILCPQVAEEEPTTSSLWNSTHAAKEDNHSSPAKRLTPEVGLGLEVAQSPSGRTRGTWSPSASPSSSILKKAQKRALEEDAAISPLVKSRRVSFANPIQHQELADDIDRRSPVVRTSSPKRFKSNSAIPQSKYVTTPTKGLLVLSPRNLHSSGYKSSKKCLMSEMSQEPRAIPKDCVFPSLVCCSAPIEAVLPLISTNMWPRGFGQLVRAKNIRTVGDLSSLKPLDIKTLPIRSPKITNVKKALQLYERKMRGFGDELKSFEEMEKMMSSSEPEETNTSLNQEEDGKTPHETLATELVDEDQPADQESVLAETSTHDVETATNKMEAKKEPVEAMEELEESKVVEVEEARRSVPQSPIRHLSPGGLLCQADTLSSSASIEELGLCTAEQLVRLHDALGGVMRSVVLELQSRLGHMDGTRR
ncbi:telomere-associated protein RIF1 isoform X2 [Gadus morhua]|uniref:telomere-associated protein RIF1 isoform X2 n=1 Tax=Gadus morhua TaxID=8049 RepID=UPI0011B40658|nr:telomere-associated protein RIF1 isoform X2 [Gadus morhua]